MSSQMIYTKTEPSNHSWIVIVNLMANKVEILYNELLHDKCLKNTMNL